MRSLEPSRISYDGDILHRMKSVLITGIVCLTLYGLVTHRSGKPRKRHRRVGGRRRRRLERAFAEAVQQSKPVIH